MNMKKIDGVDPNFQPEYCSGESLSDEEYLVLIVEVLRMAQAEYQHRVAEFRHSNP